jgi:DHA2 family multidrug resistance protein
MSTPAAPPGASAGSTVPAAPTAQTAATGSTVPAAPPASAGSTTPGGPAAPMGSAAPAGFPPAPTTIPWLGLLAVLMGTFISTLNGRLSTFGLADIRGAVHAGFDEGAWITTAQAVAQMLVAPAAVWMGSVFGPRRILLVAALAFGLISLLVPLSTSISMLLVLQFTGGLASGFFIPLTLSFVLLNTPPRYWAYGIALYALNLELSLNISASLEGWYVENLSWRWIFWQNAPLAAIMAVCLLFGVRPKPIAATPPRADGFGLLSCGLGLALIYAALDQGNRLDWLNSGLVCGLLLAGVLLFAAFLLHEARTENPLVNLKVAFARPLPKLLLLIAMLRLTILSTAYLIPLYLGAVRNFRALEVGNTLIWIALPQLIFCPLAGLLLRYTDPRLVASIGFIFVSVACLLVAYNLTPIWGSDQFLPSQLLQALGQSFALSGVLFFAVLHLRPQDALTFGAAVQVARLLGGEVGLAFVVTFSRVREQVASNLIGLHVQGGTGAVIQRLQGYAAATGRGADAALGLTRAAGVLGNMVRGMATTQAVIDTFVAVGALTAIALLLAITHRPAPLGPASARPLFIPRDGTRP